MARPFLPLTILMMQVRVQFHHERTPRSAATWRLLPASGAVGRGVTAGDDRKMNNEPLEREPIDRMRARLEALLKAKRRFRDVAPALNGRASLAGVRPCRTGAASFMVARARRRARRRGSSAAGGQEGRSKLFVGARDQGSG